MIRSLVRGVGSALPRRAMKNAEFEAIVDTSDEWITQRTGIRERRIADADETTASLGEAAARAAASPSDAVVSSASAIRRSRMPVRCVIHSSEVSTIASNSEFFIERRGRAQPTPRTMDLIMVQAS